MKFFLMSIIVTLIVLFNNGISPAQNILSEQEKRGGWMLLFDGLSTQEWRSYNGDQFPKQGWKVENGTLNVLPNGGGGSIVTKKKYADFILKLDWKLGKGGNSGIFYRALEQQGQEIYWSAPEMAILDDENYSYPKGQAKSRKAGSLYALVPARPQNGKSYDQWNSIKIVAEGPHIEHWQNGKKVVEYTLWTPKWYEMVRNSKFIDHPAFGDQHRGYVGLQDEGYAVSFRNIKIKRLNE